MPHQHQCRLSLSEIGVHACGVITYKNGDNSRPIACQYHSAQCEQSVRVRRHVWCISTRMLKGTTHKAEQSIVSLTGDNEARGQSDTQKCKRMSLIRASSEDTNETCGMQNCDIPLLNTHISAV